MLVHPRTRRKSPDVVDDTALLLEPLHGPAMIDIDQYPTEIENDRVDVRAHGRSITVVSPAMPAVR